MPEQIRATLAQRLFVEKQDLPPALIGQIRRLAAFQNPEFYKRQAMRMSTWDTPLQQQALDTLLQYDTGIFVAPPGIGKTVVAVALIAQRQCNTLVLVNRRHLLDQWRNQLAQFLGIDPTGIGQFGAVHRRRV